MRLGDDIDDHCSSCKRTTDHSIVSMTAKEAFDKVLATVTGQVEEQKPGKKKKG
jgi:hypothetical protein